MNQEFESDVMDDLAADAQPTAADEMEDSLEAEGFEEGESFEGEGMDALEGEGDMGDSADEAADEAWSGDAYDEAMDGFEEFDAFDAIEAAVADAMDAEDSDEFFGRLLGGLSRVAGLVGRGAQGVGRVARGARSVAGTVGRVARGVGRAAGQARRVAGQVGRVAGQVGRVAGRVGGVAGQVGRMTGTAAGAANPLASLLGQILPMVQQYAAQGADEMDAFDDLADWFEEEEADLALPIIAGVAARAIARPLVRRAGGGLGQGFRRQLVRRATQAARTLVRRQGPPAVRALPSVARSVARVAARRGIPPRAVPRALQRTAAQVAAQPALTQRLSRRATVSRPRRSRVVGGLPGRLHLTGPVEIRIIGR